MPVSLTQAIKTSAILLFALNTIPSITPANALTAASRCGAHATIVETLTKKYGETEHGIGLVSDQGVMQIFVSQEKGTWTILMTNAQGKACMMAAGKGWEDLKQQVKDENA